MTHRSAGSEPTPAAVRGRFSWPVWAWALWDWGSAAFNAVVTTFVFTVYLTDPDNFGDNASQYLGWALAGSGLIIAAIAPVLGQRSDRAGRRTVGLAVNTALVTLCILLMFFVRPDQSFLWLGLLLLAAGNIFFEFASVNYYAMLNGLSTKETVGRISGFGWGLGYLGGIVLLLIVYVGFISPDVGWFGVTSEDGLSVRVTMLVCALWTVLFSLPVIFTIKDRRAREVSARVGIGDSYRRLFATIARMWQEERNTLRFLIAAAVFRDGLAGVFTFGAVIAARVFGFSDGEVIIFAIAANVVAGAATIGFGWLDDRFGPKRLIVLSLVCMVLAGLGVFALHSQGTIVFWVLGLILCVFVGPCQSASRTFLARLIPEGHEGEMFGLYATTGRAASFLSPLFWSLALTVGVWVTGASSTREVQEWGVFGIVVVLLAGLLLLLPVRDGVREDTALIAEAEQAELLQN